MPNSTFLISSQEFKMNEYDRICGIESNANSAQCKNNINLNMSTLHGDGLAVNLNKLNILINNGTLKMSKTEPLKYTKKARNEWESLRAFFVYSCLLPYGLAGAAGAAGAVLLRELESPTVGTLRDAGSASKNGCSL